MATQLIAHKALEAHACDELGITGLTVASPLLVALSTGATFTIGGFLPVVVAYLPPLNKMENVEYAFATIFMTILGLISTRTGGSRKLKTILRITF